MAQPRVVVVTDSTSDIPTELAREAGVGVVPLRILFGADSFRDGIDLQGESFYAMLRSATELPSTGTPSPGDFEATYRAAVDAGQEVISLHISAALSGTFGAASVVAQGFPGRVHVVDSQNVSMAVGWVALRAAEAARAGETLSAVLALVKDLLPRAHLYAMLTTLENLRRWGRVGPASAFLGTMLQIKPIVTIAHGEVSPVERVRMIHRALERLVEIAAEHAPLENLAIAQTDAPEAFALLQSMVTERFSGLTILPYRAGPVVGTLAGPGAVAVVLVGGRKG